MTFRTDYSQDLNARSDLFRWILFLYDWVRSIGARSPPAEVGVATESGKSYYQITALLKRARIPYIDIILRQGVRSTTLRRSLSLDDAVTKNFKLIITTRRERLQVLGRNVVCIEDLGDDASSAKQKLLAMLYPSKESDWFVIGIDPGERTGIVAFMNKIEVDSAVLGSIEDTIMLTKKLLDNAPRMKKVVKIGSGMPKLADRIAGGLNSLCGKNEIRIQLVDEHGTSSLYSKGKSRVATRDQRSARLIAFRDGRDYVNNSSLSLDNHATP